MNLKEHTIRFRYVPPNYMDIPLICIPMQHIIVNVSEPYGETEIKNAILKVFPPNRFKFKYLKIEDCWKKDKKGNKLCQA